MKRRLVHRAQVALLLAGLFWLASCAGKSSSSGAEGAAAAAAADLPPRLQQEDAPAPPPPYPPAEEEPLLENAPVVGGAGATGRAAQSGAEPEAGARQAAARPRAGQGAPGGAALAPEAGARVEQGGTSEQQHVAALIPNQGPYHPIRELTRVNFGFDTDALTPQAKRILDRNAQWLAANPSVRVRVEGHCDERGTNEYNLGLGQRRADRVIAYLVSKGVQARVLHPVSFGEEVPLANGHDPQAWAQNRRVDFSYLDDDATGATTFAPEQARQ